MNTMINKLTLLLLVAVFVCQGCKTDKDDDASMSGAAKDENNNPTDVKKEPTDETAVTLKSQAAKVQTTLRIGASVKTRYVTTKGKHRELILKEFNNLTSESEMKMSAILRESGTYNFGAADGLVNFALKNDMEVHGHALVWYYTASKIFPRDYFRNFKGTDAEFEADVKKYIIAVLDRYKGKVKSWDVVNEAVGEYDEDGNPGDLSKLRASIFRDRMGDDYVLKCFRWAREWSKENDPDLKLFYNDYDIAEANPVKREAMYKLIVDPLIAEKLIDGVGFQSHIDYNKPSKATLEKAYKSATGRKLLVHISELDVRTNRDRKLKKFGDLATLSPKRAEEQRIKYKEIVEAFMVLPEEYRFGITIWGLIDSETWMKWNKDADGNILEWPLPFDADFQPKPAYTGFLEGLGWVAP